MKIEIFIKSINTYIRLSYNHKCYINYAILFIYAYNLYIFFKL